MTPVVGFDCVFAQSSIRTTYNGLTLPLVAAQKLAIRFAAMRPVPMTPVVGADCVFVQPSIRTTKKQVIFRLVAGQKSGNPLLRSADRAEDAGCAGK